MAASLPQLELDNQLCFALYSASRAAVRAYGVALGELGVTYPQYLTLLALWEGDGPMSVGALGERLRLDSGTLTPLLKRLEDAELITRARDRLDERRVLISLTDRGDALRHEATDVPRRVFADYGMSVTDAKRLIGDLRRLVDSLDRATAQRA